MKKLIPLIFLFLPTYTSKVPPQISPQMREYLLAQIDPQRKRTKPTQQGTNSQGQTRTKIFLRPSLNPAQQLQADLIEMQLRFSQEAPKSLWETITDCSIM